MSEKLKVPSVEDIEAYILGEYLKDSYEATSSKALDYCRLLIGLYRQTDTLAKELKANAVAARERASNTTHDLVAMTQRAEAAEQALALATGTTPGKGTGVWVPLDKWTELHAQLAQRNDLANVRAAAAMLDMLRPDIERFGADQCRRGNAGKEPQEFDEWQQEWAADRRAAFNGGEI